MARGEHERLAHARTATIIGVTTAFVLVAFSLFVLFRPDSTDDSLVIGLVEDVSDPSIVPTPTPTPTALPTPTPQAIGTMRQLAEAANWAQAPPLDSTWVPPVVNGAAVVDLTVINEVDDFGRETVEYADSGGGARLVSGGGGAVTDQVRAGEVMLVQNTPSGWPDPEIVCDGGNQTVVGSRVLLTLAIGPEVTCVFRNTLDDDSLSVRDPAVTCRGIEGDMRGPTGPFYLRYVLTPVGGDTSAPAFDQNGIGVVVVDGPGPFVAQFNGTIPDSGEYQVGYFVRDQFGSQVGALDVSYINFDDYPCEPQIARRIAPERAAGLPSRSSGWAEAASLDDGPTASLPWMVRYRSEIEGEAGEVLQFVDSVGNEVVELDPGEGTTVSTDQERVRIALNNPSGWPPPEVSCNRGFVETSGGLLELDLSAVPAGEWSSCVFRSVPNATSLRVTDLSLDCAGLAGTMRGPDGPFYLTIDIAPVGSQLDRIGVAPALGTFQINEPGRFVVPLSEIGSLPESGRYTVDLTIWDTLDSELQMVGTAIVTMPDIDTC